MSTPERLVTALSERYRIERELGAGGMATVYLAADLKHDRKVAIKVLKPELAAVLGAERFVQEIRTTAALSHPHILPLFDSGEVDGLLYYVMPYIQGETIREKLNRETQFGIDEAVRIATAVADALDYAHRQGVIHRDIKPENILLHDGRPMVMDFGIALAVSAAAGGRMTETGLSLGTPHYMSPEQATADKQITNRSDIYSLASVLYEMLTGEPPHMGTSAQQIIMKIIAEPVKPATELRKSVPPNVAAALAKALEKIPADRFGSASDFAGALSNPSFRTGTSAAAVAGTDRLTVPGGSLSWRAVAGVLAAAFVALAAWAATRERTPASSALVMRAELDVLSHSDSDATVSGLDISPDGSAIVYAAAGAGSGRFQLYMRRLDDRIARPIPGTEGGEWPTFSPDGASIAFVHEGRNIRRVATGGGVSEAVEQGGNRSDFRNLRWGADGFLYYRNAAGDALMRVPAAGGTPKRLLAAGTPQEPEPLPGGRHVLFTECCGIDSDVGVVDVETSETRWLGVRARSVRYLETGHLVLMAGDAMRVVPFDARNLSVQGEPLTLLDSAAANGTVGSLAIATSGTAAYLVRPTRVDAAGYRVALVDLAGSEQLTALPDANFREFRFSPDGRRIAFASSPIDRPNRWGVSVHDLAVGSTVPLTKQPVDFAGNLLWQHDGTRLLYVVDYEQRDSTTVIESSRSDGEGNPTTMWKRRILEGQSVYLSPWSVTSDGKRVLLMREHQGDFDLLTAPLDSAIGDPRDYVVGTGRQRRPVLSPDNQWVAYESDEEAPATAPNRTQIYARAFPEPGPRYAVSDSGGTSPRWSPDGKTLYYVRGRTLVAASVTTSPAFRVTSRRNLFTRASAITAYDISPDGKQFVMRAPARAVMPAQAARPVYEPPRVVVVVNWMEELRRKLAGQW